MQNQNTNAYYNENSGFQTENNEHLVKFLKNRLLKAYNSVLLSTIGFIILAEIVSFFVTIISFSLLYGLSSDNMKANIDTILSSSAGFSMIFSSVLSCIIFYYFSYRRKGFNSKNLFRVIQLNLKSSVFLCTSSIALVILSNFILTNIMEALGVYDSFNVLSLFANADFLATFLIIFSIVIVAPIIEEYIFRGVIINILRPFGKVFCIIFSSFLFSAIHFSVSTFFSTMIFGIITAILYFKTSSIVLGIIIHFLNNFISVMGIYSLTNSPLILFSDLLCAAIFISIILWLYFRDKSEKIKDEILYEIDEIQMEDVEKQSILYIKKPYLLIFKSPITYICASFFITSFFIYKY